MIQRLLVRKDLGHVFGVRSRLCHKVMLNPKPYRAKNVTTVFAHQVVHGVDGSHGAVFYRQNAVIAKSSFNGAEHRIPIFKIKDVVDREHFVGGYLRVGSRNPLTRHGGGNGEGFLAFRKRRLQQRADGRRYTRALRPVCASGVEQSVVQLLRVHFHVFGHIAGNAVDRGFFHQRSVGTRYVAVGIRRHYRRKFHTLFIKRRDLVVYGVDFDFCLRCLHV